MAYPIEVVGAFCDAMSKRDPEALRDFLADGVVYQNAGMAAKEGVEDVLADLAGQFAMFPDSYEYRMVNIAGDGEVVLTERVDMINGFDGSVHGVPVMGTFVVRRRKISRWTDYFDTGLIAKMLSGEDYAGLVPPGDEARCSGGPTSPSRLRGEHHVLRISVDDQRCQGHGRCYELAPELFESDNAGHSRLLGVELDDPPRLFAAEHAIRNCPERALSFGGPDHGRAR